MFVSNLLGKGGTLALGTLSMKYSRHFCRFIKASDNSFLHFLMSISLFLSSLSKVWHTKAILKRTRLINKSCTNRPQYMIYSNTHQKLCAMCCLATTIPKQLDFIFHLSIYAKVILDTYSMYRCGRLFTVLSSHWQLCVGS